MALKASEGCKKIVKKRLKIKKKKFFKMNVAPRFDKFAQKGSLDYWLMVSVTQNYFINTINSTIA